MRIRTKRINHHCRRCGSIAKKSDRHTLTCTNKKNCGFSYGWDAIGFYDGSGTSPFKREN